MLTTINQNLQDISEAMEKTLSRDGEIPNQMESDLDMNGHDVINADNVHANHGVFDDITVQSVDLGNATWRVYVTPRAQVNL